MQRNPALAVGIHGEIWMLAIKLHVSSVNYRYLSHSGAATSVYTKRRYRTIHQRDINANKHWSVGNEAKFAYCPEA